MVWKQLHNVKGIARCAEPTENYHSGLQLHSTWRSIIATDRKSTLRSVLVSITLHQTGERHSHQLAGKRGEACSS